MPIYSTEQINSFLDRNLIFHGQVSATDRAATRQKVQQVISSAPPEFQAAIIQGNIQYITGRGSEIDLKLGSADGRSIDEKIYFRLDSAIRTIRHETGHAVDGHIIHDMPEGVSRGAFQIPKGNYVNKPLADNQYGGSQYSGDVYSEYAGPG